MANRFRKFVESIVYAGMAPGAQKTPDSLPRKFRMFGPLERFLSAPSAQDPLYLTNRTFSQKLTRALLLAIPVVLVIGGIFVAIGYHGAKDVKPPRELTPEEIAVKVLPNFNKNIQVEVNKDVEVLEVHFEHAATSLMVGSIQNKTDHAIHQAVVVFDLTDAIGSQLGAVTVSETNLAPGAVRQFKLPISQSTAAFGLVRDVRTE
jgi:predicted component of type VI protein secretion system